MKEFLRCLLLPLENQTLVVPNTAVAEIIPFEMAGPLLHVDNSPWFLGVFDWRGVNIPLVRLEAMLENSPELTVKPNLHIAVFNRYQDTSSVDFIGIVLQNVPITKRIKHSDINTVSECSEPYLVMQVEMREQKAFIPNFQWIEEKVKTANAS